MPNLAVWKGRVTESKERIENAKKMIISTIVSKNINELERGYGLLDTAYKRYSAACMGEFMTEVAMGIHT